MNKKQFEHIENKFREAAENFQPPLQEEGWVKMDQLLDEELSRKRRGGFWLTSLLVLLLLSGAGIGIYYYQAFNNKTDLAGNQRSASTRYSHPATAASPAVARKDTDEKQRKHGEETVAKGEPATKVEPLARLAEGRKKADKLTRAGERRKTADDPTRAGEGTKTIGNLTRSEEGRKTAANLTRSAEGIKTADHLKRGGEGTKTAANSANVMPTKRKVTSTTTNEPVVRIKSRPTDDGIEEARRKLPADEKSASNYLVENERRSSGYTSPKDVKKANADPPVEKAKAAEKTIPASSAKTTENKTNTVINDAVNKSTAPAANEVSKKQMIPPSVTQSAMMAREIERQNRLNNFLSRFYFTASLASDGNAVKGSKIRNVSAMYGAGIGFNMTKRLSIQSGFYAGSKKYTADSSDYFRKPGYWRMVTIRHIDANCYVLNVPLSLRYDFTMGRGGLFYGIAGLSTYFMQKETYDYYYSLRNNDSLHHARQVFGENRHFMSVADFSLGYERRFSNHFSIQAEPYLKLPLAGIGEGKVHVYSAGFMFGLKFRP